MLRHASMYLGHIEDIPQLLAMRIANSSYWNFNEEYASTNLQEVTQSGVGKETVTVIDNKPFDKVIVRRKDNYNIWQANIFSHIVEKGYYACIMGVWSDILPYNEETAKLIETTKSLEDIR